MTDEEVAEFARRMQADALMFGCFPGFYSVPAATDNFTPVMLPEGVHFLSEASLNTLERAHVRDQILEARHTKRGS